MNRVATRNGLRDLKLGKQGQAQSMRMLPPLREPSGPGSRFTVVYEGEPDELEPNYRFDLEDKLGITILNDAKILPLVIRSVRPHSWSARKGIKRGDVMLQVGEHELSEHDRLRPEEIFLILEMLRPLPLTLLRGEYAELPDDVKEFTADEYDNALHKSGYYKHKPE